MPRANRCLIEGFSYHVINRGNNKQKIFHRDPDFRAFIKIMKEANKRYPLSISAFCLMPNHFHFVLKSIQPQHISKWVHWIMTTHACHYHHCHKTTGHIWQGRFKSFFIQDDEHLLTVLRYVEGNPVRAGLVFSSRDWPWSSHKERIGEQVEGILDSLPIHLPSDWTKYVDEPLTEKELDKVRQSVIHQSPFGSAEWQKTISQQFNLEHTLRRRGRPKK